MVCVAKRNAASISPLEQLEDGFKRACQWLRMWHALHGMHEVAAGCRHGRGLQDLTTATLYGSLARRWLDATPVYRPSQLLECTTGGGTTPRRSPPYSPVSEMPPYLSLSAASITQPLAQSNNPFRPLSNVVSQPMTPLTRERDAVVLVLERRSGEAGGLVLHVGAHACTGRGVGGAARERGWRASSSSSGGECGSGNGTDNAATERSSWCSACTHQAGLPRPRCHDPRALPQSRRQTAAGCGGCARLQRTSAPRRLAPAQRPSARLRGGGERGASERGGAPLAQRAATPGSVWLPRPLVQCLYICVRECTKKGAPRRTGGAVERKLDSQRARLAAGLVDVHLGHAGAGQHLQREGTRKA